MLAELDDGDGDATFRAEPADEADSGAEPLGGLFNSKQQKLVPRNSSTTLVEDVLDEELATRRLAATGKRKRKWLTRAEVDTKLGRTGTSGE